MNVRAARPRGVVAALLLLAFGAARADAGACWRELRFAASNGWLGATTVLRYDTVPTATLGTVLLAPPEGEALQPRGTVTARIQVRFEALQSTGDMTLWHAPGDGQVLQVQRIGHGRDSRMKVHRFLRDGVWRERFEAGTGAQPWVSSKREHLHYPGNATASGPVITPVMLLERAVRLAADPRAVPATWRVFTDRQLYDVTLQAQAPRPLAVDYALEDSTHPATRVQREVEVVAVTLQPRLLGDAPEDEPFTLFELGGRLTVFVDVKHGVPVRVLGSRFGFGNIPANLESAALQPKCD